MGKKSRKETFSLVLQCFLPHQKHKCQSIHIRLGCIVQTSLLKNVSINRDKFISWRTFCGGFKRVFLINYYSFIDRVGNVSYLLYQRRRRSDGPCSGKKGGLMHFCDIFYPSKTSHNYGSIESILYDDEIKSRARGSFYRHKITNSKRFLPISVCAVRAG